VFTGRRGVAVVSEPAVVAVSVSTCELEGEVLSEEVSRVVEERLILRTSLDLEIVPFPELFRDLMLECEALRRALRMEGMVVNDGGSLGPEGDGLYYGPVDVFVCDIDLEPLERFKRRWSVRTDVLFWGASQLPAGFW
jgi:hypothetical protein